MVEFYTESSPIFSNLPIIPFPVCLQKPQEIMKMSEKKNKKSQMNTNDASTLLENPLQRKSSTGGEKEEHRKTLKMISIKNLQSCIWM